MSINNDETQLLLTLIEVLFNGDTPTKFWAVKKSVIRGSGRDGFDVLFPFGVQVRCCHLDPLRKFLGYPA